MNVPLSSLHQMKKGLAYLDRNTPEDLDKARACFENVIFMNPRVFLGWTGLVEYLYKSKKFTECLEMTEKIQNENLIPVTQEIFQIYKNYRTRNMRHQASCLLHLERFEECIQVSEKALKETQETKEMLLTVPFFMASFEEINASIMCSIMEGLSIAYYRAGKYKECIAFLHEKFKPVKGSTDIHQWRLVLKAACLDSLGQYEIAHKKWDASDLRVHFFPTKGLWNPSPLWYLEQHCNMHKTCSFNWNLGKPSYNP